MMSKKLHDFDYPLDKKEKELLQLAEEGKLKRAGNADEQMELAKKAARNTISQKRKAITIRLPERDISRLKAQALRNGLPYQTLIASVLHMYIEGRDPRSVD